MAIGNAGWERNRMHNGNRICTTLIMLCLALFSGTAEAGIANGALAGERPRVVVSTDIGGSDPDDFQSMVHLLIYADVLDLEGLISSPPGAGRAKHVHETIAAYEKDYPKLKSHSPDYPAPEGLREITKQGAQEPAPKQGFSQATQGSNWIINRARADDERPLYALVWGSITDVAQAVHDAPEIKKNLRVYSIASWNTKMDVQARNYLINNHPDLWWIECDTTFRGMYVGGKQNGDLGNKSFLKEHVRGHGALGDFLVGKKADIKMGDTPSLFYLLRGDPNDPESDHWGGSFVKTDQGPNYWTDNLDPTLGEGSYRGAKTVNKWRADFLGDWQARMDRTLAVAAKTKNAPVHAWALWDAEGGHLGMDEILAMREKYGATIYFFRNENKQSLDLKQLKDRGITLIKVAHPGYAPFKNAAFLADQNKIRGWALHALANPNVDGLALDVEGPTAHTKNNAFRILSQEARKAGKTFHAVPHFALFDRWEDALTAQEFNEHVDVVWPWLYNRFKTPSYKEGLIAMLDYWKGNGVTLPTYPIFDHGRTDYSGITPAEASEVPLFLREKGIEAACLFQPHVSFRGQTASSDFTALWDNLRRAYGE
jgi:hypothetical protein